MKNNFYLSIVCGLIIGLLIAILIILVIEKRDNKERDEKINYIYEVISDQNSTTITK